MKAEFYTVRGYDETGARTTRKVLANSHTQHSPYETRLNGLRRSGEETIAGLRATCKQVVVVVGGREVGIEN